MTLRTSSRPSLHSTKATTGRLSRCCGNRCGRPALPPELSQNHGSWISTPAARMELVMAKQTAGFVDHGLTPEQMREAVRGHYYEYPGMDGEKGEIWCYTRRYAYPAGA